MTARPPMATRKAPRTARQQTRAADRSGRPRLHVVAQAEPPVANTAPLPLLTVHDGNLPATARALRDVLVDAGTFYERGGPVRVVTAEPGQPLVQRLNANNVTMVAHELRENSQFIR